MGKIRLQELVDGRVDYGIGKIIGQEYRQKYIMIHPGVSKLTHIPGKENKQK